MRSWLISSAWSCAAAQLLFCVLDVASAHAQSDDERARTHFEAGRSYYEQARYDDAAREFQQSFELSARPELLLNLSQAQERGLHYDEAIEAARRYLALVPQAPDRKTVEDRIANLETLRARFLSGAPAPLDPPGSNELPASGAAATPPVTGAGELPATTSEPKTAPLQARRAEPENKLTIPAIILMSTGGAALVASLVTGLVAHADYKSLKRQCNEDGLCPPVVRDELDEGKALASASTVLTIVGVVAAGTGTALLIVGSQQAERRAAGQLSLSGGPTPLSIGATLTF